MEMRQLLLGLLWIMLQVAKAENETTTEQTRKLDFRIDRVRIHGENHFMRVAVKINENRKTFDIYVMLNRELGSNYLLMNTRVHFKLKGAQKFETIVELKHMDFCAFIAQYNSNSLMRHYFQKTFIFGDIIACPVRARNYTLSNVGMGDNMLPDYLLSGTYKFFTEIIEGTGEIPKVFSLQVISTVTA
ncbi:CG33631 [Drosophila busckii]|uniref:CG33631 n=1 Tax=Drosophila busckii TaxID=30019 RepID=A0A0M3QXU3_DROBS|nr:uncharacterized protein LOC108602610 [Drosophila busckii]ALC46469.1 CG33631 [Drosophila busckii]